MEKENKSTGTPRFISIVAIVILIGALVRFSLRGDLARIFNNIASTYTSVSNYVAEVWNGNSIWLNVLYIIGVIIVLSLINAIPRIFSKFTVIDMIGFAFFSFNKLIIRPLLDITGIYTYKKEAEDLKEKADERREFYIRVFMEDTFEDKERPSVGYYMSLYDASDEKKEQIKERLEHAIRTYLYSIQDKYLVDKSLELYLIDVYENYKDRKQEEFRDELKFEYEERIVLESHTCPSCDTPWSWNLKERIREDRYSTKKKVTEYNSRGSKDRYITVFKEEIKDIWACDKCNYEYHKEYTKELN